MLTNYKVLSICLDCPVLRAPANALMNTQGIYEGLSTKFYCLDGYLMTGASDTVVCRPDGTWDYRVPECVGGKAKCLLLID